MTTEYKYFSKHFFRNVFICLLIFFAFCLFIYKNETVLLASVSQCFIKELPDDYLAISGWYIEDGKPKSAIKVLQKACKNDPDNYGVYLTEIGNIYINEIGDHEAGIQVLKRACTVNANDTDGYINLGNTCDNLHRWDEAISAYKKAIQLEPDDPITWRYLGDAYASAECHEEAIRAYRTALRIEPETLWLHIAIAYTYKDMKQYDKAIEELNHIKRIEPHVVGINVLIADFYFEAGHYEEAIAALKHTLELEPDRKGVHFRLGKAHLQLGNRELALKMHEILKIEDEESAKELLDLIGRE